MRLSRKILLGLAAGLVAIQLVPVPRDNPPVESDVPASPEMRALLRRACYDCHSHETAWPPYARIAPVSWLVAYDVWDGRRELNFSRWGALPERKRTKLPRKMTEEVREERDMPPLLYRWAHPGARLTDAERAAIAAWGESLAATPR